MRIFFFLGKCFVNGYGDYFGMEVDMDACIYLMLANDLIHRQEKKKQRVTKALCCWT